MNTPKPSQSCADCHGSPSPKMRIRSGVQPDENLPLIRLIAIPGAQLMEFRCQELILGRHSSADLQLPNREVSRFHCRLYHIGQIWHVEDMDSLNGTMLNGEPIQHAVLQQNDVLRIADYLLQVDFGTGEERASEHHFLVHPSLEAPPPSEQAA